MGSIGRYMFRTTMGAFVITLVSLTVVMWFTQAIREFDLITSQRQTMFVFIGITGLLIPLLVMMIARYRWCWRRRTSSTSSAPIRRSS
jgi:lipopolysaccharide export system permease protein